MDDLPIEDTTRQDLSADSTFSDNDNSNIREFTESGRRLSHGYPSGAANFNFVDGGRNESAEVGDNIAQMSQKTISGDYNLPQATTSVTEDANQSTPTARLADEVIVPDPISSGNGSPFRSDQATPRAIGNANEGPSKRRRKSSGGVGRPHPRPPKPVRGADQPSTKRQLAARPLPVFGGYRTPVITTVGDTETIKWVSTDAAGTPLSPNAPRPVTTTPEEVPLGPAQPSAGQAWEARSYLSPTQLFSNTGHITTAEGGGAITDLGRASISSTPGQVRTAPLGQPEELLRILALQARAQLQSESADQASRPSGVQQEHRENLDAMVSNSNHHVPPRRFGAPFLAPAAQINHMLDWRSTTSMEPINATKGRSALFFKDHSKDPIVTPSVDRKAHLDEFKFRLRLHAGRESLETIRLLKPVWSPALLEKRDIIDTDEIPKYNLRDFSCEDRPRYMALSYVWGEETPTRAISINGTVVQVRKTLAQALQSIAHFDPHTYVFADAICINQQDDREKSTMVQHMAQIFSDAWLVYAWLGPAQDSSTEDLLTHFSDLGKLFWQHVGPTESYKLGERSLNIDTILTRNIDDLFSRFEHPLGKQGAFPTEEYSSFSARPFWSRIWVLQEVYLAKRLYYACGSRFLASNYLAGALILLEAFQRHLIRTEALTLERSVLLRKFALEFPSFPEMHRLIVYTSIYPMDVVSLRIAMTNFCVKELPGGSKATDLRDMIYGLLGFCNEEERTYIHADYSKSVQSVYTAVTRAMIRNGFTDIMSWAQIDAKRIANLPSWVPDYSSTIYESLCSQGQAKPWLPQFRACNEAKYNHDEAMHPIQPLAILVHGRQLDRVMRIGRRWFPRSRAGSAQLSTDQPGALFVHSVSYEDLCFFLDQVRELVRQAEMRYSSDRLPVNIGLRPMGPGGHGEGSPFSRAAIWRMPCCDQIVINGRLVRGDPTTESRYEAMIRYLEACKDEPKNELPAESRPYLESLLRWADKRPFVTEHGFVGLGPANMEPGDTLAVLDGFNACYLVKPQRPPSSEYRLVGEAYVDGIMDGEMIGSIPDTRVWFHLV
ncbi:heterokaryon incompatibility protein-domain-containing protein [Xylaria cubensis]|nr:heterokaryon incompatibility protein-domain-containing protein [Xylaria cubensis]